MAINPYLETDRATIALGIDLIYNAMDRNGLTSRNQQAMMIANLIVESRFDYAREESVAPADCAGYGGGCTFSGRGFIQLTHDFNYETYGDMIGVDLLNNPELALEPENSAAVAVAFWMNRPGLVDAAERGDVAVVTRLIQGAAAPDASIQLRGCLFERGLIVLGGDDPPPLPHCLE